MRLRNYLRSAALVLLTSVSQEMLAQQQKVSISPTAKQVSYSAQRTVGNDQETKSNPLLDKMKNHRRMLKGRERATQLKESRLVPNNLLMKHAPIQITAEKLRQAARAKTRAPYVPDNNHKHLIVNVVYNSIDDEMDEGLFDLDVVTGELTFLTGNFIEDYDNYGFNGGGYVWNGKYRGVFYSDEYDQIVSNDNQATIMEFDMSTWELTDIFDIPYMSSMALECATQYNADGSTTVLGQYWGVSREGELSLRYATLDDDGILTSSFGASPTKHMLAMGVTSDGRLYGVAKDGNLYRIDRPSGEEILVGPTGIEDIVDYEGGFWLQCGEIDPSDNTFYWMAEHTSVYWTQLCSVNLQTGKATPLIDFAGDVQSMGMVIAPPQRKAGTPGMVTNLTASFAPLQNTGTGSFTAPTVTFGGQQLDADAQLCYHIYVNDVKQTLADNQTKPGATVSFSIANNVKANAENTIRVTVSLGADGEEGLSATTTAWMGYGIPEAPKNAAMTFDAATNTATITWEPPTKGDNAGVKGGTVDLVSYFVYRVINGERAGSINNGAPLADDVRQVTYQLTEEDLNMSISELSFAVEACSSPWSVPQMTLVGEAATTNGVTVGKGKETPYFVDFANNYYNVNQKNFTIINNNNDDRFWEFCPPHYIGGQSLCGAVACSNYSGSTNMDDWFITPGIALKAGITYHYKSYVHGPTANVPYIEHGEVWMGKAKTVESMTMPVIPTTRVCDYMYIEADFTVPEDGDYYFGIHSVSAPDQWEIALFDIYIGENIEDPVDLLSPAAGQMAVTPIYGANKVTDNNGKTVYCGSADIHVTLPTEKLDGTPLTSGDLLDVTVTATPSEGEPVVIAQYAAQAKGTELTLKAEDLPSGHYTFSLQTSIDTHRSPLTVQNAYVGWDDAVATPTGMYTVTSGNKFYVQFPELSQPTGANGAYLPQITYRAYGGSKASQLSYYAEQGYDYVYDMIDADAVSVNNKITVPDFDPQEGQQYLWRWYLLAVSKNAAGKNIYSPLTAIRGVVGEPMPAPVIETGEYELVLDADISPELTEVWNYYLNRGQVVCGVSPIEDQFGYDVGKSWNIFSAFNGDLSTYFGKVDIAWLTNPVLAFDIILEDPETGVDVILNGPYGHQFVYPLTVMDGVQHISIPLDEFRPWGWVQPTLKTNFHIAQEGDRIHDIYLDNVGVYDQQPCNLAINGLEAEPEMKAGQESMVNVTVMNLGQKPVRNYTVSLIEDEVTIQTQTFTRALQPGEVNVVQFPYQPNTITDYDVVGQEEAEKVLVATVEAEGDYNEDDNSAEAVVTIAVEGGKKNSHPERVVAQQVENSSAVNVTWSFDFQQSSQVVTESFEDYELWSTGGVKMGAPEGRIGDWKLYDADGKPTYTWNYFDMISSTAGEPQAFQVFDGQIFSGMDNYYYYDLTAVTGNQYLVSMDPSDGNYIPKPDDYFISPIVPGGSVVEFYYGSLLGRLQGLEVLYSETGQDISDFKLLKTLDDATTTEWFLAYITLPATAKYFAIHHNKSSHLGYGLKIDDITYNRITAVDHFNVYVDGRLAGTSEEASFTIREPLENGKHRFAVTAVYADGTESIPAYASLDYDITAISDILMSGKPFDVYSTDGKLMRSQTRSVEGLKGVFVIDGKTVILK